MQTSAPSQKPTSAGDEQPLFHPFTIGGVDFVALSDGYVEAPAALLAPEIAPGEVTAFMWSNGRSGPLFRVPLSFLFARLGGRTILVDSGMGKAPAHHGAPILTCGRLTEAFQQAGIDPSEVDTVLVSHIHPDHVGGLFASDDQPIFPNAEYFVSQEEIDFWGGSDPDLSGTLMPPPVRGNVVKIAQRFLRLAGDRLKVFAAGSSPIEGVDSLLLEGHTPGQVGFVFKTGETALFFTADAAGDPLIALQKPDWRFSFDTNSAVAIATRKRLVEILLEKGWRNFTPHFPWPSYGQLRRDADGVVRWSAGT